MANLFDSQGMALGYARFRPPLQPMIVERIRAHLGITRRLAIMVDIGCGAGLSTAPMSDLAAFTIGLEPSAEMLALGPSTAPMVGFVQGVAEAIPIRSHTVDLATAAGSLNWVDLGMFFPEAARILKPDGTLVIYDYQPGRAFRRSDLLANWYLEFERRFPPPRYRQIDPDRLGCEPHGLQTRDSEEFEIGLWMTAHVYLEYLMTEIGVARAIQEGVDPAAIRSWLENTLSEVFQRTSQEVLFRGYIAYVGPG